MSLPIELILEFLSRLPIEDLTRLSCASKYLYNSVHQNPQFGNSHLINYSQKHPFLVFYINRRTGDKPCLYKNLFHTRDIHDDHTDNYNLGFHKTMPYTNRGKYVGFCNGLVCFKQKNKGGMAFVFDVYNFITRELLRIVPPFIHHRGNGYTLLSHGFGFDSLNNEYKLVLIVFILETRCPKCFVYTFGKKSSWKDFDFPDDYNFYPRPVNSELSATFTSYGGTGGGGGALFWMTIDRRVILLFDLHEDKFQYIRIPLESPVTSDTKLFEHKGFLGVAILEMKSPVVAGATTSNAISRCAPTSTLEKVHLKILKAYKDEQVWIKETFDLSPYSIPFSSNFRLVSFSDHVLLYWVDPKTFRFFNLHRKCLKVVRNIAACIFDKKVLLSDKAEDYWLNCEVGNISSLKTLLPERAQKSDRAGIDSIMKKCLQQMWILQQPRTVGGVFTSFYKSKTNEHYFFDD
ncbi:hypothetical protein MKW98_027138 [Papaver atlanticum]|uniref:F-box domain-containing protein n=1 Tax=Papaver atlanticum TaxID=357466 RepID=A0AAD4XG35_9MAGN|nr:hypothetical protein MKW98_027138 [Papaver atlanticum]